MMAGGRGREECHRGTGTGTYVVLCCLVMLHEATWGWMVMGRATGAPGNWRTKSHLSK